MIDRFIIELEPAVWYRDWVGTHRTTNINDAHIFGSAVRATKEIVRACKHRPYPNARVVAVSTVVQPIEETVHIRSLSEQVKAILPRTMYRFSALAPDIASILVDVTSVRNRLELVDLDDIPGMIAEMELAIAGLSTATKEESKRAACERVAPTVREIIRERSPEGARRRDVEERFQRVGERIRAASAPSGIPRDPATERLLARIAELEAWQADAREKNAIAWRHLSNIREAIYEVTKRPKEVQELNSEEGDGGTLRLVQEVLDRLVNVVLAKKDPPFPHVWWASLTPGQREHYIKEERLLLAQRAREEEKARAACPYTLADLGNMPAGTKLWDSVRPSVCYLKAGDGRWTIWWTWTLPDEAPAFGDFDASVMLESPVPWTATEPVLDPAGAVLEKKPTPEPGGEDEAWKRLWRTEHSR